MNIQKHALKISTIVLFSILLFDFNQIYSATFNWTPAGSGNGYGNWYGHHNYPNNGFNGYYGYTYYGYSLGYEVATLPAGFFPIAIDGVTYYTDNYTYYKQVLGGYALVPTPITTNVSTMSSQLMDNTNNTTTSNVNYNTVRSAPAFQVTLYPGTANMDEIIVATIPNLNQPGYTSVTLKREDKGFIGPKGELYAGFPKVAQLQALYGKPAKPVKTSDITKLILGDKIFFDSGSVEIKTDSIPTLDRIIEILNKYTKTSANIQGYSDDMIIKSVPYKDNMEISNIRANNVYNYLIKRGNIDPSRLNVSSFGESKPVSPNDTRESRALNRRVEITISETFKQ